MLFTSPNVYLSQPPRLGSAALGIVGFIATLVRPKTCHLRVDPLVVGGGVVVYRFGGGGVLQGPQG